MTRVCVFCGSKPGSRSVHGEAAARLAKALLERKLTLVYGGAKCGLMGTIADTVLAGGGEVIGVIPKRMVSREIAHEGVTELHVVDSMQERKEVMMKLSDSFVALPGGYGTLDEVFEVATWSQLGLHGKAKLCGLLNVEGFFDTLIAYLDNAVVEGFLKPEHRALILDDADIDHLLERLACVDGVSVVDKW